MKATEFLHEQDDVLQNLASDPIPLDAAKEEFNKKATEFEFSGISVNDIKIGTEGTTLTLQQGNVTSTVTFVWGAEEDIGPFASVKPQQGEAVNLDLTPLSPPVVDTASGRQIDISNLSWLNKEAFEGIMSAAGLQEVSPEQVEEPGTGDGSGAATPTNKQPQSPAVELDAKTVPAPKPQGQPGEALIERAIAMGLIKKQPSSAWLREEDAYNVTVMKGKDTFNVTVGGSSEADAKKKAKELTKADNVMNISKQDKKKEMESVDQKVDTQMKCKKCGYIASETSFERDDIKGYEYKCPECGSLDVMDAPSEINHNRMRVKPTDVKEDHMESEFQCKDCGYKGSQEEFSHDHPTEIICPECGSENIEELEESMENQGISLFRFIIREGKRVKIPLGEAKKKAKQPHKVVSQKPYKYVWDKKVKEGVDEAGKKASGQGQKVVNAPKFGKQTWKRPTKEGLGEAEISKKFFITMANELKRLPDQISKKDLIDVMIRVFQAENPRFDADRFIKFIGQ